MASCSMNFSYDFLYETPKEPEIDKKTALNMMHGLAVCIGHKDFAPRAKLLPEKIDDPS